MPLRGGEAVPSDGLTSVLRNALAELEHAAQVELSGCKPLCRCKAEESQSRCIVLSNAKSYLVALAAASSLATPNPTW